MAAAGVIVSSNTFEDLPSEPAASRTEGVENRRRAIELGHVYYLGPACKHGHGGRRYTNPKEKDRKVGRCVECTRKYMRKRRRTPEHKAHMREYRQTPEYKARERKRQRTPEYKAHMRKHRQTPEHKAYMREYQQTPEYKAYRQEYNQRCREERTELSEDGGLTFLGSPCGKCGGTRRYVIGGQCVSCNAVVNSGRRALEESWEDTWDTADWLKASALCEEAAARSRRTGVAHEVDHIVPLAKGGAHHPDNMQIISAKENRAKGAKDWAEEDHLAWLLGD